MKILLSLICLSIGIQSFSQNNLNSSLKFGLEMGMAKISLYDQSINYYQYSSQIYLPFHGFCSYQNKANCFKISGDFNTSKLQAENINPTFYSYNYMNQFNSELNFSYTYTFFVRPVFSVSIGMINNSYYEVYEEFYRSYLYNNADVSRKSYDITFLNLMPCAVLNFNYKKSDIEVSTAFSIIHLAARPDNNFANQFGVDNQVNWRYYHLNNFSDYLFSVIYNYHLYSKFSLSFSYRINEKRYLGNNQMNQHDESFCIGISKTL